MKALRTFSLFGLFVAVVALAIAAEPPYPNPQVQDPTNFPYLSSGRVMDRSVAGNTKPQGVPMNTVMFMYPISGPETADVDYFVTSFATGTGTTAQTLTLAHKTMQTDVRGMTLARNLTATLNDAVSTTTSTTVAFTGTDIQDRSITETVTWAASASGLKATVKTFKTVSRAVLTNGTAPTTRTLTVGFGNVFGLPYPFYSDLYSKALYDDDGADYPNTSMSTDVTFVAGDPTSTSADHLGTVLLGADNATGNKTPNGTRGYAVLYCVTDVLGVADTSQPGTYLYDNN